MKSLAWRLVAAGFLITLASCGGSAGGGAGGSGGEAENGDNPPQPLAMGEFTNGTIPSGGEVFVPFQTGAAGDYNLFVYVGDYGQEALDLISPRLFVAPPPDEHELLAVDFCQESFLVQPNALYCLLTVLDEDTTYWVNLPGFGSYAGAYSLVVLPNGTADGSLEDPVVLTPGVPHATSGSTEFFANPPAPAPASHLRFQTGEAGDYTLHFRSIAGLSLQVFSDDTFITEVSRCEAAFVIANTPKEGTCVIPGLDAATAYFVRVTSLGGPTDEGIISAVLTVAPGAGPESEGSVVTPVDYPVLDVPHNGTVAATESSFYTFTTPPDSIVTPQPFYDHIIRLDGMGGDLGWTLYADDGFLTPVHECDRATSAISETCTATLAPATPYYLKVSEASNIGTAFTLTVSHAISVGAIFIDPARGSNAGSVAAPVALPIDEEDTQAFGSIDGGQVKGTGQGFYQFTTGEQEGVYTVTAKGWRTLVGWTLYSDPDFTDEVPSAPDDAPFGCSIPVSQMDPHLCQRSVNLAAETTYYLALHNYGIGIPTTLDVFVSPFALPPESFSLMAAAGNPPGGDVRTVTPKGALRTRNY